MTSVIILCTALRAVAEPSRIDFLCRFFLGYLVLPDLLLSPKAP